MGLQSRDQAEIMELLEGVRDGDVVLLITVLKGEVSELVAQARGGHSTVQGREQDGRTERKPALPAQGDSVGLRHTGHLCLIARQSQHISE